MVQIANEAILKQIPVFFKIMFKAPPFFPFDLHSSSSFNNFSPSPPLLLSFPSSSSSEYTMKINKSSRIETIFLWKLFHGFFRDEKEAVFLRIYFVETNEIWCHEIGVQALDFNSFGRHCLVEKGLSNLSC